MAKDAFTDLWLGAKMHPQRATGPDVLMSRSHGFVKFQRRFYRFSMSVFSQFPLKSLRVSDRDPESDKCSSLFGAQVGQMTRMYFASTKYAMRLKKVLRVLHNESWVLGDTFRWRKIFKIVFVPFIFFWRSVWINNQNKEDTVYFYRDKEFNLSRHYTYIRVFDL